MATSTRLWGPIAALLAAALLMAAPAAAQKQGGTLRLYHRDSPASMSIHEEATISTVMPIMPVFNNLVVYDQHVEQNTLKSIVPDLASDWNWSEGGKALTFKLRERVKWHDGKPFTAKDVKCTWDLLLGKSETKLRLNPRRAWYGNLEEVVADNDYQATFRLKRPQPALPALLASGYSPVYPCHVPPAQMRQHPVGTGPFKFIEYKPNEYIKLARNPDYWKPGRPYLDGIEFTIIPNRSTAKPSSIFSARAKAISAVRCCRRRKASGACRSRYCRHCPATAPISRRTVPRGARSWRRPGMDRTSTSRSRSRLVTSRRTVTRR